MGDLFLGQTKEGVRCFSPQVWGIPQCLGRRKARFGVGFLGMQLLLLPAFPCQPLFLLFLPETLPPVSFVGQSGLFFTLRSLSINCLSHNWGVIYILPCNGPYSFWSIVRPSYKYMLTPREAALCSQWLVEPSPLPPGFLPLNFREEGISVHFP